MKYLRISPKNAALAYNMADDKTKEILDTLLGGAIPTLDTRPITERVKSYEDACTVLEIYPRDYSRRQYSGEAFYKLSTIAEALNEGWTPKFTEEECRYYPYLWLYTQEDIGEVTEEEAKDLVRVGNWTAGFACTCSKGAPGSVDTGIAASLCLKSSELALYSGKQFAELWADYFFKVK